jgi:hypothetical protein
MEPKLASALVVLSDPVLLGNDDIMQFAKFTPLEEPSQKGRARLESLEELSEKRVGKFAMSKKN